MTETYFNNGDKIYFTADTHFGHKAILQYCNRPFETIEEMNEALINNWNSKVSPGDIVFHLGDFAFGKLKLWTSVLERLNGIKYLVLGNHDFKNMPDGTRKYFKKVTQQLYINIGGQKIYLNHYPFLCYGGVYRTNPVWQLFGHVHTGTIGQDTPRLVNLYPMQYDVGVDNNNYTPISYDEVVTIITRRLANQQNEAGNSG